MWYWIIDVFLLVCLFIFMIDKLTFLWVRRCYDLFYHLMIRTGGHLIFIDIDDFGDFNNQYGHPMGNKILRRIGSILLFESCLRAFRYGGDELVILLPWTTKEKARQLAENIRIRIEQADIEGLGVTVTCAVAKDEETADKLLLQAKGNGKNKVTTDCDVYTETRNH